jgi:lipopolysaccharide export system permease protein
VSAGKYTLVGFMLALHGGALLFGLLWLAKRHYNWSWRILRSAHSKSKAPDA